MLWDIFFSLSFRWHLCLSDEGLETPSMYRLALSPKGMTSTLAASILTVIMFRKFVTNFFSTLKSDEDKLPEVSKRNKISLVLLGPLNHLVDLWIRVLPVQGHSSPQTMDKWPEEKFQSRQQFSFWNSLKEKTYLGLSLCSHKMLRVSDKAFTTSLANYPPTAAE